MQQDAPKLVLTYDPKDLFDRALRAESERGHHSRCFYGNKAKISAAASGDPGWDAARVKFMPELKEVHYTYAGKRFAQRLAREDVRWLDRFDAEQTLRYREIVLDPAGPRSRVIDTLPFPKPEGRAARPRQPRKEYTATERRAAVAAVRSSGKPVSEVARELGINKNTLGDWATNRYPHRGAGCDTHQRRADGKDNSGRANRMRELVKQRLRNMTDQEVRELAEGR